MLKYLLIDRRDRAIGVDLYENMLSARLEMDRRYNELIEEFSRKRNDPRNYYSSTEAEVNDFDGLDFTMEIREIEIPRQSIDCIYENDVRWPMVMEGNGEIKMNIPLPISELLLPGENQEDADVSIIRRRIKKYIRDQYGTEALDSSEEYI